MHIKIHNVILVVTLALSACNAYTDIPLVTLTVPPSATNSITSTESLTPLPTDTPLPTASATASPIPTVQSLSAVVTADLLSCRYGPGAEYLYLYALRKGARIKLIGQTGGNNWAWVEGRNKCWLNMKFIEIAGDPKSLPIVYPAPASLPVSPYYPPTTVLKVLRDKSFVTISWLDIPLRAGDEEDESMLHYIIEVWRCEAGQIIFNPLATNDTSISFIDESGCSLPSHGRIFVQEKHGFAGPAEIPWP